jgi:hypothetical protein
MHPREWWINKRINYQTHSIRQHTELLTMAAKVCLVYMKWQLHINNMPGAASAGNDCDDCMVQYVFY